jgi:PAS domain-containing protein
MTPTRAKISGIYPEDLEALARPIAWSGTVSQAEREEAERDVRDLLAEIREALDAGAQGVFVWRGRLAWTWNWSVVEILREQAEEQGREDFAQICDEVLQAEEEMGDEHRQAIWDALIAGSCFVCGEYCEDPDDGGCARCAEEAGE